MPKRAKNPTITPDDVADALEDALVTTNELLAGMLRCLSCPDCQGTGQKPTRAAGVSERCECRRDAAELLYALESEDGPDDEDTDEDDEEIEGI